MTVVDRRHGWLMGVYVFGGVVSLMAAWFPSFLCRAGGVVLLVGLLHMIWQRREALRKGWEEQTRLRRSVLYYAPFLAGTNLVWMGLPVPADAMAKAWVDCLFLAGSVGLLSAVYLYNNRALKALSDLRALGTNPHSEEE